MLLLGQAGDKALDAIWGKATTGEELMRATSPGSLAGMTEKMKHAEVIWVKGSHYTGVVHCGCESVAPEADPTP